LIIANLVFRLINWICERLMAEPRVFLGSAIYVLIAAPHLLLKPTTSS
jgi:hypothetical protein